MVLSAQALLGLDIPAIEQSYTARDAILYALGVGFGSDPEDEAQLPFAYEKGLKTAPTFATVLAYPGLLIRDLIPEIDWTRAVHSGHRMILHQPLPAEAEVVAKPRIVAVADKGEGNAAILYLERDLRDRNTGTLFATLTHTLFCRGAGGFGGQPASAHVPRRLPDRRPDLVCDLPTLAQGALLFRLNGDRNPLHAEPAVARIAGFPRPILHGLATWGFAGHALLKLVADYDPGRIRSMEGSFSAPGYPGEVLRVEIWRDREGAGFRVKARDRNVTILDHGYAELAL